jgi:3-hydroxyisobutyrate dehydrogenase-like beta-hydroxyacid dehydrogenase
MSISKEIAVIEVRDKVGFIGLGNVGSKLAGTLARNGVSLAVVDTDPDAVAVLVAQGAVALESPAQIAAECDVIITCLPSPAIVADVMEGSDGVLGGLRSGSVWIEMSTAAWSRIARYLVGVIVQPPEISPSLLAVIVGPLSVSCPC